MGRKVLIAAPVHNVLLETLQTLGYEYDYKEETTQQQALEIVGDYEGVITSTRLNIDKTFIDKATKLKWVGRMGSGMEIIDVSYAESKGIQCFSSPEGNANAVAEQALGMLLALQHKIFSSHTEMQQGIWLREENRGTEIEGLTAGIIGYGNNGSAFAKKLKTSGLKILALDKYRNDFEEEGITECKSIEPIWEQADIISFHLPLTTETQYYFDEGFLNRMQKPFTLLNLSRGKVVEQASLYTGLKSGKIKGAALDVWEMEPVGKMEGVMKLQLEEMLQMPNFIATPHIGGYTVQALYKMSYFLVEKIKKAVL
ncbi:hydroxyacid dehydrogenase [Taibaiella lutea]|uniref:Hydroxyacid dehydrogenase n=1 Tax=Taibaiella lutea TaxID=2608001 RepID=A0A5M6CPQ9_9BACT|nr:NAD(P)-dependent oxidoreductase [Taibaiella lutea]KAA5537278.1 hydroxyacid dehydrogenase [Taibaiella lutea]